MDSRAHSLLSVAVLFLCATVIVALMVPAIAQQRAQARATACGSNLRILGLAAHNYHDAFRQLPPGCGGTDGGKTPESSNEGRLGPLVAFLPFANQQELWELIVTPYTNEKTKQTFPSMGPVPWYDETVYQPWSLAPAMYSCPDRAEADGVGEDVQQGQQPRVVYTLEVERGKGAGVMTNYVLCYGDGTLRVGEKIELTRESRMHGMATMRGMFQWGHGMRIRDTLDGTSNTLMMSETRASLDGNPRASGVAKGIGGISKNPSLCLAAAEDDQTQWWDFGRGSRWSDGALPITGFQTVLPPNSISCTSDGGMLDAIASASSSHQGGVHVLFMDGRVGFVTDQIDTGNLESPGVAIEPGYVPPGSESPYGIWGAIGTRAGKERIRSSVEEIPTMSFDGNANSSDNGFVDWKDRTGKTKLSAKFVRIIDKHTIELEDVDGVMHQVPLNTLDDKDIFRAVRMSLSSGQ